MPSTVVDNDLADTKALPLQESDDIAMHLALNVERLCRLARVDTEGTAGVVHDMADKQLAQRAADACEDADRVLVCARLAPAGHHVEAAFPHSREKARDVCRVVLSVAVERDNYLALRLFEAGVERGRLAVVAVEVDNCRAWERRKLGERGVGTAVVYVDDLECLREASEHLPELGIKRSKVASLVIDRHDDGNQFPFHTC